MEQYSFNNRVKFVIRYFYDTDNNGYLDQNDFDCLAVRNTVIELRGKWDAKIFETNRKVLRELWCELAKLADFDKNGEVTAEEFKRAIQQTCAGKKFAEFPAPFKTFIGETFKTIDLNGDGVVGIDEYRLDCSARFAFSNINDIDDCYNKLVTEKDKKAGGITLARYQELYSQFISNPDEKCNAVYLFGPIPLL